MAVPVTIPESRTLHVQVCGGNNLKSTSTSLSHAQLLFGDHVRATKSVSIVDGTCTWQDDFAFTLTDEMPEMKVSVRLDDQTLLGTGVVEYAILSATNGVITVELQPYGYLTLTATVSVNTPETVTHSGWLNKTQIKKCGLHHRRWFELRGNMLEYYTDNTRCHLRQSLCLDDYIWRVVPWRGGESLLLLSSRKKRISLKGPADEVSKWSTILSSVPRQRPVMAAAADPHSTGMKALPGL